MDNESIVRAFFTRWAQSFDDMCASFDETFADECRWDQRPLALTIGTGPAIGFLRRARRLIGLATIDVEILKIASAGDSVLCQRVDHLRRRSGRLIASVPVVGVLDLRGNRIVEWREYYDAYGFVRQAGSNAMKGLWA